MVQHDDSAHPKWDLLYAEGLPPARIAALVGARVGTIKRHLERRRAVDPGLAVEHNTALRSPSEQWLLRLAELVAFIEVHDRYPIIRGIEQGEASLYGWLAAQRHALLAQKLSWRQAEALGVLGDWVTTDRERAEDARWRRRLGEVVDFFAEHGRWPRHRTAESELEHGLGIWLQTQGIETHHGRIMHWRFEALNEALPGWRNVRRGE